MAKVGNILEQTRCEAEAALRRNPVFALRKLTVQIFRDDSLVIQGAVSSFYHKQLAQEIVRASADGMTVVNSVAVDDG